MRRIAAAVVVAGVLFSAAVFYATQKPTDLKPEDPTTDEDQTEDPQKKPTTEATVPGTLELKAKSSHGYVHAGDENRLYAALDVRAGEFEDLDRPPLNVALVVDRSGSMRGKKLQHAREAAHTIVDELKEGDRLSLVSYASGVEVDVSSTHIDGNGRDRFHRAVREFEAGGGTNIERAIRTGLRQVERSDTEKTVDRVLLVSDGKPTVGASSTPKLAGMTKRALEDGRSVTTMGVGLDYNEDLMTRVANVGGGNYYFIDSPEEVVSMFEKELSSLAETVAERASLVVELGEGVELETARGYPHDRSGDEVRVSLSKFSAGQNKSLLLEFTESLEAEEPEQLIGVELSYEDLRNDGPAHQTATLTAAATDDAEQVKASIDESVISRVQQVKVAKTIDEAMEDFEEGDKAEAEEKLDRSLERVESMQKNYDISAEKIAPEKRKIDQVKGSVESEAPSTARGKEVIKQNKEESNMMMLDSTNR